MSCRHVTSGRLMVPLRGLSCAVIAMCAGLILSDKVDASCGDYLHLGNSATNAVGSNGTRDDMASLPLASNPADGERSRPKPCDGPRCRQRLPDSLPPAPVRVVMTVDELAFTLGADADASQPDFSADLWEQQISFDGHPFRLQRPPRV